jgi:hypothetical protein
MRLEFDVSPHRSFDGRRSGDYLDVIDRDTGKKVGYIRSNGVGYSYGGGGIFITLFDGKYSDTLNKFEECWGFIKGVEAVLNHLTEIQDPHTQADESNAA